MSPARLVVLASGNGSNLGAVLDSCADGVLSGSETAADVVAVVSDRADAFALERADRVGIPAEHVPVDGRTRAIYDGVLAEIVAGYEPDLVVLAGWMRLLTSRFVARFPVVNLHPALPGEYPGLRAIERAFADAQAGRIDRSGVMVHRVPDEGVDDGPVIATATVEIRSDDTLESFAERMHAAEHRLLPEAIAAAIVDAPDPDRLIAPTQA